AFCTDDAHCAGIGDGRCLGRAGDGCSPLCEPEVIFSCNQSGSCRPTCGDGITVPGIEECDDANLTSGDGCSAACTIEPGYTCTDFTLPDPATINVPIVVRDFRDDHPDMEKDAGGSNPGQCAATTTLGGYGLRTGMVEETLDADGKPVVSS